MKQKKLFKGLILVILVYFLFLTLPTLAQVTRTEVQYELHNVNWLVYGIEWMAGNTFHVRDRHVRWEMVPVNPAGCEMLKGFSFNIYNANFAFNNQNYYGKFWGKVWIETDEGGMWTGSYTGEVDRSTGLQMVTSVMKGEGIYSGKKLYVYMIQRIGSSPTIMDCHGYIKE